MNESLLAIAGNFAAIFLGGIGVYMLSRRDARDRRAKEERERRIRDIENRLGEHDNSFRQLKSYNKLLRDIRGLPWWPPDD